jgi:hypothetical protein
MGHTSFEFVALVSSLELMRCKIFALTARFTTGWALIPSGSPLAGLDVSARTTFRILARTVAAIVLFGAINQVEQPDFGS